MGLFQQNALSAGANIKVDDTTEAGIYEFCDTAVKL